MATIDYVDYILIAYAVILPVIWISTGSVLWTNKSLPAVRCRSLSIKLFGSVSTILSILAEVLADYDVFAVLVGIVVNRIFLVLGVGSFLPTFYRHSQSLLVGTLQEKLALDLENKELKTKLETAKKRSKLASAWLIYLQSAALPVIASIVLALPLGKSLSLASQPDFTLYIVGMQLLMMILCGISYLLFAKRDNLGLKSQYLLVIFLATIVLAIEVMKYVSLPTTSRSTVYLIVYTFLLVSFALDTVIPVLILRKKTDIKQNRMTYKIGKSADGPNELSKSQLLQKIVSGENQAITNAFTAFLSREYCLENFMFLRSVHQYEKLFDLEPETSAIQVVRNNIIKDFVVEGATNEVNLPARITALYTDILLSNSENPSHLDRSLFQEAENLVQFMIIQSHLGRFCDNNAKLLNGLE